MNLYERLGQILTDERLLSNLIALHVLFGLILVGSMIARRILISGGDSLSNWTGLHWLDGISREATRRGRAILFWVTLLLLFTSVVGSVVYHLAGRDIRYDVTHWYENVTSDQMLRLGIAIGQLVLLGIGLNIAIRLVRVIRVHLELRVRRWLHSSAEDNDDDLLPREKLQKHEVTIRRWFMLLEKFALATLFLTAVWASGHILHVGDSVDTVVIFLIRMVAILMVARLLTLACRTLSHTLEAVGNRQLAESRFLRYWNRVTRLFPFGESCFEAAVYISAATLCVKVLHFISEVADYGPRLVTCIGIFFTTRVLIELVNVLLNEAFSLNDETKPVDQKGLTLVPLLQSVCQYTLYFGSGVIMLGMLGFDTKPILASAGILGLAIGLGAQSLVTDVVSGFFILFENQFLVGDIVQIGDAGGRVEAMSIRHTQIRDDNGKLIIVPNGQIKTVVNYSKGYVNAVVDIKVSTNTSLEEIIRDLTEAGRKLRQTRREVLADTVVKGLIDLSPGEMTIRAVTKVQPGAHHAMQNEFRRLLKEVFDGKNARPTAAAA